MTVQYRHGASCVTVLFRHGTSCVTVLYRIIITTNFEYNFDTGTTTADPNAIDFVLFSFLVENDPLSIPLFLFIPSYYSMCC